MRFVHARIADFLLSMLLLRTVPLPKGPRVGTLMGDTSPNHNSISSYRNPTFYYTGTLDPLTLPAVHEETLGHGLSQLLQQLNLQV